jgi:hypothetical protein
MDGDVSSVGESFALRNGDLRMALGSEAGSEECWRLS